MCDHVGRKYKGSFKNDVRDGDGVLWCPGEKYKLYDGEWRNGIREGTGKSYAYGQTLRGLISFELGTGFRRDFYETHHIGLLKHDGMFEDGTLPMTTDPPVRMGRVRLKSNPEALTEDLRGLAYDSAKLMLCGEEVDAGFIDVFTRTFECKLTIPRSWHSEDGEGDFSEGEEEPRRLSQSEQMILRAAELVEEEDEKGDEDEDEDEDMDEDEDKDKDKDKDKARKGRRMENEGISPNREKDNKGNYVETGDRTIRLRFPFEAIEEQLSCDPFEPLRFGAGCGKWSDQQSQTKDVTSVNACDEFISCYVWEEYEDGDNGY